MATVRARVAQLAAEAAQPVDRQRVEQGGDGARREQRLLVGLVQVNLPYISPTSPPHLPYISPRSPLTCWSGLCRPPHSLASSLLGATPAEHVKPSRRVTWLGSGLGLGLGLGLGVGVGIGLGLGLGLGSGLGLG